MSVRVRFAPSPTGYLHIGGLRTALYNYLFAMQQKGTFLLRIEDTDQTRLVPGAVEGLIEAMAWAGVTHSEGPVLKADHTVEEQGAYGPYVQSARLPIYRQYIEQLLENDHAYTCFCTRERLEQLREEQKERGETPRYDGHCRSISLEEARKRVAAGESHVIRMKLPENTDVTFEDLVLGPVTVNTSDLDDQVLMKADGYPTYHFAVIVDDNGMGITHVIRGQEWLPSTPKHVLLYQFFGWQAPKFVHLPNILNSDKKKLSKRQGDVAVEDFKNKGYLPEALVNYIALLGWSPEDNTEFFTMDELISRFSLERVSKSGGVFDVNKLNWMNGHYIRLKTPEELCSLCMPWLVSEGWIKENETELKKDWCLRLVKLAQERMHTLADISSFAELFSGTEVTPENEETLEMLRMEHVPAMLKVFKEKLEAAPPIDEETAKGLMKAVQADTGIKGKNLFMPIRAAISGQLHGPDMNDMMIVIGRDNLIARIDHILSQIG